MMMGIALFLSLTLSACDTMGNQAGETIGTVVGMTIGALLGSEIGDGSGQVVATVRDNGSQADSSGKPRRS